MKKKAIVTLLVLVVLVGIASLMLSRERSKAHRALADYKAKLRAQGETLTFEEAGYPFPLATNANLENFVALADLLRGKSEHPGSINLMLLETPGRVVVVWAGGQLKRSTPPSSNAPSLSWDELSADMSSAAELLAELRAELEHPPRHFGWNYTNPFNATVRNPFVQKRVAAQFLAVDTLAALHERQLPRAQADLHALTQLAQVHRGDLTLVSAMIRVAIAGLALSSTWQALPAEGWDESSLAALQRDWEALDLVQALETGLVGERIFGQQAFKLVREAELGQQRSMLSFGTTAAGGSIKDKLVGKGMMVYWRGHADEDELLHLQYSQARIESLRCVKTNAPGVMVLRETRSQSDQFTETLTRPLSKYRYLFTASATPNSGRAIETALRCETQRRMTITVIALKRFQLQRNHYPASLAELMPGFLAAELVDPWSGKPFHYQLHPDGSFTLYSVGEDGRDDGGNPNPVSIPADKKPFEIWMGKDVVWPTPVFPVAADK
jgi:hypothetical protein